MHKLMEYLCDELEELERKADKDGKLSMAEVQYMDTLLHAKKNLLKSEEMYEESEYSNDGGSYARGDGRGRGRNARRDSMGRYSSRMMDNSRGGVYMGSYDGYSREDAKEDLRMELHELERDAKDEETRHMIKKWIKQLEQG